MRPTKKLQLLGTLFPKLPTGHISWHPTGLYPCTPRSPQTPVIGWRSTLDMDRPSPPGKLCIRQAPPLSTVSLSRLLTYRLLFIRF